ncbi:hypothetical protein [Nostoc sp.]|uniref:hypothetical protein n=1 Tax=Nostoc sp. TaxID=1180 RepID=UPI002FF6EBBF
MTIKEIYLTTDYFWIADCCSDLYVITYHLKGESWMIRGTDEWFGNLSDMNVKWQMIIHGGKREAKRLAIKAHGTYQDFGRFLVTEDDYTKIIEQCIETHDTYGLRMIAALRQGDDKAEFKKKIEKIIKVKGLNEPHEKWIKVVDGSRKASKVH